VPFGTAGKDGPFYGALETGIEFIHQDYFGRATGYWAGLGLAARYHLLALGRFRPLCRDRRGVHSGMLGRLPTRLASGD
jgi:hypothetical protein